MFMTWFLSFVSWYDFRSWQGIKNKNQVSIYLVSITPWSFFCARMLSIQMQIFKCLDVEHHWYVDAHHCVCKRWCDWLNVGFKCQWLMVPFEAFFIFCSFVLCVFFDWKIWWGRDEIVFCQKINVLVFHSFGRIYFMQYSICILSLCVCVFWAHL